LKVVFQGFGNRYVFVCWVWVADGCFSRFRSHVRRRTSETMVVFLKVVDKLINLWWKSWVWIFEC